MELITHRFELAVDKRKHYSFLFEISFFILKLSFFLINAVRFTNLEIMLVISASLEGENGSFRKRIGYEGGCEFDVLSFCTRKSLNATWI